MKTNKYTLVFLMLLLQLATSAQDFHLSQFNAAPHYFNAAQTGVYYDDVTSDYRIYSDYHTQWGAFGIKPYSTFYAGYDMPFKEQFGLGGYLISNRNGKSGMNTFRFMPSGSYRIIKDKQSEHQMSVGAQLGLLYSSFDPKKYTYENQFTPDGPTLFDQNIYSGENYTKTSFVKFDAAMGVFYKYSKTDWQAHPFAGFSVYNLARPNRSLSGFQKDNLSMRWVYQFGADWKINEQVNLRPMLLYMNMAKAHELNIGATGSYILKETHYSILGGLNYRTKDAFIIQLGMKYNQHSFMISYDINTSDLSNYTHSKGAFELSIKLVGIKGQPMFRPKFWIEG